MLTLEGRWLSFSNSDGQSQASDRLYQAILSGRLAIADRYRITVSAPYSVLHRTTERRDPERINGLSDMSIMGEVQVLPKTKDSTTLAQHQLWLGLGLKAPTGEFRSSIHSFYLPPNFQLGTGTWDGLASLSYRMQKENWAMDGNLVSRTAGENHQAFTMPWLVIAQSNAYKIFQKKKAKIVIGIGAHAELIGATKSIGIPIDEGGYGVLGMASTDYQTKNYTIGVQLKQPVSQSYGGGNTVARQRLSMRMSFVL
jgi:hypothetical protein